MARRDEPLDPSRDKLATGNEVGGAVVGGVAGGAAAGALAGTVFGPIGTLIGATVGAGAGAAAGKELADRVDAGGEADYWRNAYDTRSYAKHEYDFDRDYLPAYQYGLQARDQYGTRGFDENEDRMRDDWNRVRGDSRLDWNEARPAVRDAFNRADRTYNTYAQSDRHFESRFGESTYTDTGESFEDYRPAYRYGVHARTRYGNRQWDQSLDEELARDWERNRGNSSLSWERARHGVREAYSSPYIGDYNSQFDDKPDYNESGRPGEGLFRVR